MVRSESTEHPKISHAIPLVQASMNGENRDISTVQLQVFKEWKPNCIRHFPTTLQDQRQKVHYDAPHSMIHRLTRTHVRKHRAPNGALRLVVRIRVTHRSIFTVRKHRAPNGAFRHGQSGCTAHVILPRVRKHRAPKGTLRRHCVCLSCVRCLVRKHRSPKDALRLSQAASRRS